MQVLYAETSVRMVQVNLKREVQERVNKLVSANRCLTPGCERDLSEEGADPTRGLCSRCYQAARRLIRRGIKSDQDFVKEGLLLGRGDLGRPLSNPMSKHIAGE